MLYFITVEYKGFSHDKDAKLRKAAGCSEDGAGFYFGDCTRDVSWSRKTEAGAQRLKKVNRVKVIVTKDDSES